MGQSTAASSTPNATVMAVEVVPRQAGSSSGAGSVGAAAVGSSGTTGSTGSSTGSDRVYRITLRMDDGSTQVVTQETTPDFRSGDRVSLAGGMIQH
jgi:outer membrane lipoprotein SlyB